MTENRQKPPQGATASIGEVDASRTGIAAEVASTFASGIGRAELVVVDLRSDDVVLLRERLEYLAPFPTSVRMTVRSQRTLERDVPYRAFFHVYDRTGANLVAYDRRDFTWC